MIRLVRRLAAADPITKAVSRPTQRFFAVAALAAAAVAPAGSLPLPTAPLALPAITAGAVLTAVDSNGQPLAHAVFEVYRADQPEGVQTPLLTVPGSGRVTVPLPPPSTIPDPESNYYAVSTGVDASGSGFTGVEFFNLTSENPLAQATITPNLFQVPSVLDMGVLPPVEAPPGVSPSPIPTDTPIGDIPTVPPLPSPPDAPTAPPTPTDTPSVRDLIVPPPVGDIPTVPPIPSPTDTPTAPDPSVTPTSISTPPLGSLIGTPPPSPTGPCGYNPDAQNPPGPFFTITSQVQGVADGTVNVGVAHGAGDWPGNTYAANVRGEPYKVVGEDLVSDWSRATESSVMLGIDIGGQSQTPYQVAGNLHFTLASGDMASFAATAAGVSRAGEGARALITPATWLHQTITFHCNYGDKKSETHDLWSPHEWQPRISTSTPDFPSSMDSLSTLEDEPMAVVFPLAADQWQTMRTGESEVYQNGFGADIGGGPIGFDWSVYSQTTYAYTHEVTVYAGDKCGTVEQPNCMYWAVNTAAATDCPWQMGCGTDYYTAVLPGPTTVPNPEPQPCSKYEPHGACD